MTSEVFAKSKKKIYTLEEYFEHEEKAVSKSEFQNGKIVPMAGGTLNHNRIKGDIFFEIKMSIRNNQINCEVFDSDQKIYIPSVNHGVYSDTCVVCGKVETYRGGNQAILNPTLIVEVASDSTSGYDRTQKFRKYKSIPAFKEYVLVDQETPIVDVLFKMDSGDWRMKTYMGLEGEITLESIDVNLKMKDIYKNVPDLKDPQTVLEFDPEAEK